jgi:tetratricopeptide (TPR) repeat protein
MTLFYLAGETALAETFLDRALALNPNRANAWWCRGLVHAYRNQPEAAIEALARALRLSPFDLLLPDAAHGLAVAHLAARRFETAIDPGWTIARYRAMAARYLAPEVLDLMITGLRLAGLREG